MITVGTYAKTTYAEIDKGLLEAEGIRAFVLDEASFSSGYGSVLGVRLQVEDADGDRAREILSTRSSVELPDDMELSSEQTDMGGAMSSSERMTCSPPRSIDSD